MPKKPRYLRPEQEAVSLCLSCDHRGRQKPDDEHKLRCCAQMDYVPFESVTYCERWQAYDTEKWAKIDSFIAEKERKIREKIERGIT